MAALGLLLLVWGAGPAPAQQKGATLELADGFEAELLYTVPLDEQDSWVSCTFGPHGDLYAGAEGGPLYRVSLDEPERGDVKVQRVETRLHADGSPGKTGSIRGAQGLCWAYDSLYAVGRGQRGLGLYRLWDSNDDGQLDANRHLGSLDGGGDHGPHAVVPSPDGEAVYVIGGNHSRMPKIDASRQPRVWQEDLLLPRITDPRGHAGGIRAPGGWLCRVSPDGEHWELVASGMRNAYDIAFNRAGEMFTYDSDMEWDVGLPWYRPTRLYHAVSGAEFGWRTGSGKWPEYYPDATPPVTDTGRGSPTGVSFGYGADFPKKYQNALFLCDWSYGRVFAAHLTPDGASYDATLEPFIQGAPFPVVDITIGPDGAMYLITGGRHTQSWLYRVTYEGTKPTSPASPKVNKQAQQARKLRRKLEAYHSQETPEAIDAAWPHLGSEDRFIRYAARLAIENQPTKQWAKRALNASAPQTLITAMVALTRHADAARQGDILAALGRLDWQELSEMQKLGLLRAYQLCFSRLGEPTDTLRGRVIEHLNPHYPAGAHRVNRALSRVLAYLEAPGVIERTLSLMAETAPADQQIDYAYVLRTIDNGWTLKQRKQYFRWFNRAAKFSGGASFAGYINRIEQDALKKLDQQTKKKLKPILEAEPEKEEPVAGPRREIVKEWEMEDLMPALKGELKGRNFERGKRMFAAANCFQCHRFNGRGGATGPDLTSVGQRFSRRYILESIIKPSEAVSNQYQATVIEKKDGSKIIGRVVNMFGGRVVVQPNAMVPSYTINVPTDQIESTRPYEKSLMPAGLINRLKKEEILDLFAYMLSAGNPEDPMFDKPDQKAKKDTR
jgi:putative heme-binding domain-containing protein